jgi:hypothetical protein
MLAMPVGLISSVLLVLLGKPAFSNSSTLEFKKVIENPNSVLFLPFGFNHS